MVIELGMLKLKSDVTQEQFLLAVEETTAFLKKQGGFIRRVVSKNEHGQWADMVYWASREAAERAGASFMLAAEAQQFMGLLVPEELQLFHFQTVVEQQ